VKVHPNDKAAQIRLMRKNMRRLQNHQKNPALMDALARGALEVARARIEELELEVARLRVALSGAPMLQEVLQRFEGFDGPEVSGRVTTKKSG
jgi:predicted phosphoribosyltransferase